MPIKKKIKLKKKLNLRYKSNTLFICPVSLGLKGTPIFFAPEIWQEYKYSKASDVYAFAFIVYEILTLNEPFKNCIFPIIYTRVVLKGERPELDESIPGCHHNLIKKCWSPNPDERMTFNEIVEELKKNEEFRGDSNF